MRTMIVCFALFVGIALLVPGSTVGTVVSQDEAAKQWGGVYSGLTHQIAEIPCFTG